MATRFDITIGGVDVICRIGTLSISETVNGRNTLTCEVLSLDATSRWDIGEEIIVEDNGVRIFGGNLSAPSEHAIDDQLIEEFATSIKATDFNALADRRTVVDGAFPAGFTLKQAATSLLGYLSPYGVTLHASQVDGPVLPLMGFPVKRVSEWFHELSVITGYIWNIDYNKVLRFIEPGTVAAPFFIADDDGHTVGDIVVEPTDVDYANRIILLAGTGQKDVNDTVGTANGVLTNFPLTYRLSSNYGYVNVGGSIVDGAIVGGVNEPLGVTAPPYWTYDLASNSITRSSAPAAGSIIIPYTAQFPYFAQADDAGEQAGPRGLVEKVLTQADVFEATLADALAAGHLARRVVEPRTIRYGSHTTGLHPGQVQAIVSSVRDISLIALITEVRARDIDGETMRYDITAVEGDIFTGSWRDMYREWGGGGGSSAAGGGVVTVVSSGGVGGTGTAGKLAKWATASTLGDSILTESTSLVTAAGAVAVTGSMPSHLTSSGVSGFSGGNAFFIAYGADASTKGGFQWLTRTNSGTSTTVMVIDGPGSIGLGAAPATNVRLDVQGTTTGVNQWATYVRSVIDATATGTQLGVYVAQSTAASAATTFYAGYRADNLSLGAGASVANQYGVWVTDLTSGTLNAAFRGAVSAGSSKFNLYMDGTALNYFGGGVSIGNTNDDGTGNVRITGNASPNAGYSGNLGLLNRKWLTLHAAELWVETLVAQNTIATIGGRVLVAPTNILTADFGSGDTTIPVKYNNFANGDRVYMEADGKVEFMAITSGASGSPGAYTYSVTRNLDGSGANDWFAGDAVLNTGTTGDGFIDLYSVSGVLSGFGPTIVGNVRTGTTYSDIAPRWAIGNLNGLYGYAADTYGAVFGDASATNVAIDATNGFRVRHGTTNKFHADTSGNLSIVGDLSIGTSGVIRSGATAYGTGTGYWLDYNSGTPRFRIGNPAGVQLTWNGTTLVLGAWTVGPTALTTSEATLDGAGLLKIGGGSSGFWASQLGGAPARIWIGDSTMSADIWYVTANGSMFADKGLTVGATGSVLFNEAGSTPTVPGAGAAARLYMKADKLIVQYNLGGTAQYFYLDLTSGSGTWTYTTSAP